MTDQAEPESSAKPLDAYPRPSVAVDTAVLTLSADFQLMVLQVRRPSGRGWALPGTFLHEGETLADAVDRCLRVKANVRGLHPRQLHVFDKLGRDDRGWVLSVAHLQVVRAHQLESRGSSETRLVAARSPGQLPHDHSDIIQFALESLQSRYATSPDPDGLLGDEFTLLELRLAHEAVAGEIFQRDVFRRAMWDRLEPTGDTVSEGRGRPARTFRRKPPVTSERRQRPRAAGQSAFD